MSHQGGRRYADIALRLATPGTLQFEVPSPLAASLRPGHRVLVPLRARHDVGYVLSFSDQPKVPVIRPIERILDPEPSLSADLLALLPWLADRYLSPVGTVLRAAIPAPVHFEGTRRSSARARTEPHARLLCKEEQVRAEVAALARRSPVQAGLLARLLDAGGGPLPVPSRLREALRALERRGMVAVDTVGICRGLQAPAATAHPLDRLTPAQEEAFRRIEPAVAGGLAERFLLHGVTGSGKTEIYLRAVRALPPDRQALILVPEVSLTVQLIRHLLERLPFPLAVWHHQLSDGEKHDLWRLIRRGGVRAVVGTRSAVFAPFPRLGLIVVDEEQEPSFKQEETPCYHAREVAAERARLAGGTLLLGSATPSLESYQLACGPGWTLLRLPERYHRQPLPEVTLVDLKDTPAPAPSSRQAPARGLPRGRGLIATPLLDAAGETLARGEQVLFFLNRRGYAPLTQCRACGAGLKCPNCGVSLVFHMEGRSMLCHYCGYRIPAPDACPSCGAATLALLGSGTQRLEREILDAFPGHRVLRLDRDTAARKGAGARVVDEFESGRADILVGTQMVAKGLHFPRLTLVGVIGPDLLLNLPDFRAAERAFALVAQVSGRAGRGQTPGRVIVQTYQPEHYALTAARDHDYAAFAAQELRFRRELSYPPFCELVLLRLDGLDRGQVEAAAEDIARALRTLLGSTPGGDCEVLGPVPAPLQKIRNRYRYHLLVKTRPLEAAAGPLRGRAEALQELARRGRSRLVVDVGPQNLM